MILVLDTGGVEALAPADARRRALLRVLREEATDIVLPAAVLAEGVLTGHPGRDFHLHRLLDVVNISVVDGPIGIAAGALRQTAIRAGLQPPPSGVDAVVAVVADAHATRDDVLIVTSDAGDLEMLGSLGAHAEKVSILVV